MQHLIPIPTPLPPPAGEIEYCPWPIGATRQEVVHPLPTLQRWPVSSDWLIQGCKSLISLLQGETTSVISSLPADPVSQGSRLFLRPHPRSAFSCSTFSLISFSWKRFLNKSLNQSPISELIPVHFPLPSSVGRRTECNIERPVMYALCENSPCKRLGYISWISCWIHL